MLCRLLVCFGDPSHPLFGCIWNGWLEWFEEGRRYLLFGLGEVLFDQFWEGKEEANADECEGNVNLRANASRLLQSCRLSLDGLFLQ